MEDHSKKIGIINPKQISMDRKYSDYIKNIVAKKQKINAKIFIEAIQSYQNDWFTPNPDHYNYNIFYYLSYCQVNDKEDVNALGNFFKNLVARLRPCDLELIFCKDNYIPSNKVEKRYTPLQYAVLKDSYYYSCLIIQLFLTQGIYSSFKKFEAVIELDINFFNEDDPVNELFLENRRLVNYMIIDQLLKNFKNEKIKIAENDIIRTVVTLINNQQVAAEIDSEFMYNNKINLPLLHKIIEQTRNNFSIGFSIFEEIKVSILNTYNQVNIKSSNSICGDNTILYAAFHVMYSAEDTKKIFTMLFKRLGTNINLLINPFSKTTIIHKLFYNPKLNSSSILEIINEFFPNDILSLITSLDKDGYPSWYLPFSEGRSFSFDSPDKRKQQYIISLYENIVEKFSEVCLQFYKKEDLFHALIKFDKFFGDNPRYIKLLYLIHDKLLYKVDEETIKFLEGKKVDNHGYLYSQKNNQQKSEQRNLSESDKNKRKLNDSADFRLKRQKCNSDLLDVRARIVKIEKRQSEINSLKKDLELAEKENRNIKEKLDKKIRELNEQVNQKDQSINEFKRKNIDQASKIEMLNNELAEIDFNYSNLLKQHKIMQQKSEINSENLRQLVKNENILNVKLEEEIRQKTSENEQQNISIVEYQKTIDNNRLELEKKDKELLQTKEAMEKLQYESSLNIANLEKKNTFLCQQLTEYNLKNEKLLNQTETIEKANANLKKNLHALINEEDNLGSILQPVPIAQNKSRVGSSSPESSSLLDLQQVNPARTLFNESQRFFQKSTLSNNSSVNFNSEQNYDKPNTEKFDDDYRNDSDELKKKSLVPNGSTPVESRDKIFFSFVVMPQKFAEALLYDYYDKKNQNLPRKLLTNENQLAIQLLEKNSSERIYTLHSKGLVALWGEEAMYQFFKMKYCKNYNSKFEDTDTGDTLFGKKTTNNRIFKIKVEIIFPNKTYFSSYKESKLHGKHGPFDMKVIKTILDNELPTKWKKNQKIKFFDTKTTKSNQAALLSITKNEWDFIRENNDQYFIYRIYAAGEKNAYSNIIKDIFDKFSSPMLDSIKLKA